MDLDETVYSLEMVKAEPEKFRDVKYIFSTWGMEAPDEEQIRSFFPALEAVFYGAGTVQKFARPFLHCGVKVFSAWAANAVPVAEFTFAQIILANKGYFQTVRRIADYRAVRSFSRSNSGNYDATVGIIGAGMIGKMVIERLKTLDNMKVLVFDPFLPDAVAEELGVEKVELMELFERSEIVSNHLANNEQTKGMLKYGHFAAMKPYATFINTGRAAQLVEEDLFRVMRERPDLTALCDVTNPEPPVEGSPYYTYENIFLSPHIAGSQVNECRRMAAYMAEECRRYVSGEPTRYEVSLKMLETMA
ncbi:MAG: hydroxyacid dehydrogenase [Clostridia bacterium]|nr:hydroxyacid dehydrogenase [Clostridia bacterium]